MNYNLYELVPNNEEDMISLSFLSFTGKFWLAKDKEGKKKYRILCRDSEVSHFSNRGNLTKVDLLRPREEFQESAYTLIVPVTDIMKNNPLITEYKFAEAIRYSLMNIDFFYGIIPHSQKKPFYVNCRFFYENSQYKNKSGYVYINFSKKIDVYSIALIRELLSGTAWPLDLNSVFGSKKYIKCNFSRQKGDKKEIKGIMKKE